MEFYDTLEAVRASMEEISPEHKVAMAINGVFASLDDLIALAASPDTRGHVCAERIALGQMLTRCQMLCSFALAGATEAPVVVSFRR